MDCTPRCLAPVCNARRAARRDQPAGVPVAVRFACVIEVWGAVRGSRRVAIGKSKTPYLGLGATRRARSTLESQECFAFVSRVVESGKQRGAVD